MVQGSVDGLDRHLVSGWAYDSSSPNTTVVVSIFLSGDLLLQTAASTYRTDLAEAGIGDGCHSFLAAFPERIKTSEITEVSVFADNVRLPINPQSLATPGSSFIFGSVHDLDGYGVAGWVYNKAAPNHPVAVSIFCAGGLLAEIDADLFRPDLASVGFGNGHHGFRYPFDRELPAGELASISVRAGTVALPRHNKLEPFFPRLPDRELRPRDARVFPVSLRNPFSLTCDSILGRLLRLSHKKGSVDTESLNLVLSDLREVVRNNTWDKLHLERLTLQAGGSEAVQISRANTHFISLDRHVPEFRMGYEPEILAILDLLIPDDGVFIDVGSNWGYFALATALREGFRGKVYAFEPSSHSNPDLVSLVAELGLQGRVHPYQLALGDRAGSATLSVGFITGLSSIAEHVAENLAVGYEEVSLAPLDHLDLPPANVIKIDVEGAESDVIRGGRSYIQASKPAILFENWLSPDRTEKTLEPLKTLSSWGYEFFLPCWTDKERSLFASVPLGTSPEQALALCPIEESNRSALGDRINILALRA